MSPHILVVRPGAIGDALLAFPALAALRHARPRDKLTFIAHPAVGELALGSGLVDLFISRDDPRSDALFSPTTRSALRSFPPLAAAVAWTNQQDTALLANLRALGAEPIVIGSSRPGPNEKVHAAEHLLNTLAPFGICERAADWSGLSQFGGRGSAPGGPLSFSRDELSDPTALVVLHPGSGSRLKNWSPANFARLADGLSERKRACIYLIIGPADEEARAIFETDVQAPHTLLVERPLEELARLLARCDLYVGNDSAISHLAGLCGAPTLALFGPTEPRLWRPLGRRVQVIRKQPLEKLGVRTVLEAALASVGFG